MNNIVTIPLSYAKECDLIGDHTNYRTGGGLHVRYKYPGVPVQIGLLGVNEYGCPLSACHGYMHDAQYWAYIGNLNTIAALKFHKSATLFIAT